MAPIARRASASPRAARTHIMPRSLAAGVSLYDRRVSACLICERVALAREGRNPHLVAEMEHSLFVVGDPQFHRGYAGGALKQHVREPYELSPDVQGEHFREVMRA